jgi:glycosyltransferase involved in cell wall biosynthesis
MKISIVTACYNSSQFIRTCVQSVLSQGYDSFEHIIIDGGSTDGTLEILEGYPHLIVVSEPDQGLYDAWNKGIALSQGDVVAIMNSDDFYGENVFQNVKEAFESDCSAQIVTGKALQCSRKSDGSWMKICDYVENPAPVFEIKNLSIWGPMINARFFKKSVFENTGKFNLSFETAADVEYMIKIALKKYKASYIDQYVYYYVSHLGSLSLSLKTDSLFSQYAEKVNCTEKILKDPGLNSRDKAVILNAYTEKCARDFIYFLTRKRYENAKYFYRKGRRHPLKFFNGLVKEIVRVLKYKINRPFMKNNETVCVPRSVRESS